MTWKLLVNECFRLLHWWLPEYSYWHEWNYKSPFSIKWFLQKNNIDSMNIQRTNFHKIILIYNDVLEKSFSRVSTKFFYMHKATLIIVVFRIHNSMFQCTYNKRISSSPWFRLLGKILKTREKADTNTAWLYQLPIVNIITIIVLLLLHVCTRKVKWWRWCGFESPVYFVLFYYFLLSPLSFFLLLCITFIVSYISFFSSKNECGHAVHSYVWISMH